MSGERILDARRHLGIDLAADNVVALQFSQLLRKHLLGRSREELLELARVVAHTKERRFAPLATYTAGIAAERLREAKAEDAAAIAAYIREVREALEKEPPA